MKASRLIVWNVFGIAVLFGVLTGSAQVVINEIVDDERSAGTGQITDTREFIELYNAGSTAVNIGDWTVNYWLLGGATGPGSYFATNDPIPTGTMLAAGDYYVIGPAEVANVDLVLPSATDLFPNTNYVMELRDGPQATGALVDALAVETFRNQERANFKPEHGPQAGGGYWGQIDSYNTPVATNGAGPLSLGRYLDGRDTNNNGRDFTVLPISPGAPNDMPENDSHSVPDVDSLAVGTKVTGPYYASFVAPRVIDPTSLDALGHDGNKVVSVNPNVIPASPQGGKALILYDETGGGNVAYSREYVNKFDLYAYIETAPLGTAIAGTGANPPATANENQADTTFYGLGSADPFFSTPDHTGILQNITSSLNGAAGVAWAIQRIERYNGGSPIAQTFLQLVDANDTGDSVPEDLEWETLATIDLTGEDADWHRLGIEYDPVTGDVVARHNNDVYNVDTETGLLGHFYVGWRESLVGVPAQTATPFLDNHAKQRPATFDMFVPVGLLGDFNEDDKVDAADYVVWRKNGANPLPNDNGLTTSADRFNLWKANFGNMSPGSGSGGAVPEPSSIVLLLLGVGVFAARVRRGQ